MTKVIELADGYNGGTAKFYADPIARDGDLVKLQCADRGKEYMTAWKHVDDLPNDHCPCGNWADSVISGEPSCARCR